MILEHACRRVRFVNLRLIRTVSLSLNLAVRRPATRSVAAAAFVAALLSAAFANATGESSFRTPLQSVALIAQYHRVWPRELSAASLALPREETEMNLPGFTAEALVHRKKTQYRTAWTTAEIGKLPQGITLAGTCTCTDPNCTWTCPSPPTPDPCARCRNLADPCARARCYCICNDGIPVPSPFAPCHFVCT
jgi:hypothetical protein